MAASAQQAAQEFYKAYRQSAVDGLPTAPQMRALRIHLSDALATDLASAQSKQSRCRELHPSEKPPWVEGDLFTSNTEGFTRVTMRASDQGNSVIAEFEYVEASARIAWKDEIVMKREHGRWVVDDVRYGRHTGASLRQSLAEPGC
jgi:hypothetical protein